MLPQALLPLRQDLQLELVLLLLHLGLRLLQQLQVLLQREVQVMRQLSQLGQLPQQLVQEVRLPAVLRTQQLQFDKQPQTFATC